MGSGGFFCTPRMSALIAQAGIGVLPSDEGGQELRDLYQNGQFFCSTLYAPNRRSIFPISQFSVRSCLTRRVCLDVFFGKSRKRQKGYASCLLLAVSCSLTPNPLV